MADSVNSSITIHGNVTQSQVGHSLTNCQNQIQALAAQDPVKPLLEELHKAVAALQEHLPEAQKAVTVRKLEGLVQVVTSPTPDRDWYDVSAKGLLEAAKFAKDFSSTIVDTMTYPIQKLRDLVFKGE